MDSFRQIDNRTFVEDLLRPIYNQQTLSPSSVSRNPKTRQDPSLHSPVSGSTNDSVSIPCPIRNGKDLDEILSSDISNTLGLSLGQRFDGYCSTTPTPSTIPEPINGYDYLDSLEINMTNLDRSPMPAIEALSCFPDIQTPGTAEHLFSLMTPNEIHSNTYLSPLLVTYPALMDTRIPSLSAPPALTNDMFPSNVLLHPLTSFQSLSPSTAIPSAMNDSSSIPSYLPLPPPSPPQTTMFSLRIPSSPEDPMPSPGTVSTFPAPIHTIANTLSANEPIKENIPRTHLPMKQALLTTIHVPSSNVDSHQSPFNSSQPWLDIGSVALQRWHHHQQQQQQQQQPFMTNNETSLSSYHRILPFLPPTTTTTTTTTTITTATTTAFHQPKNIYSCNTVHPPNSTHSLDNLGSQRLLPVVSSPLPILTSPLPISSTIFVPNPTTTLSRLSSSSSSSSTTTTSSSFPMPSPRSKDIGPNTNTGGGQRRFYIMEPYQHTTQKIDRRSFNARKQLKQAQAREREQENANKNAINKVELE